MALNLPPGLNPAETAFICEMEMVTVIPRQRLEGMELLGGPIPPLLPPHRSNLPLWLALLLVRQKRANILPPPWLNTTALNSILDLEKSTPGFSPYPQSTSSSSYLSNSSLNSNPPIISPPFQPTSTAPDGQRADKNRKDEDECLPYHYAPLSHLLLTHCAEDIPDAEPCRRLLRDISEIRMAKMRAGVAVLEGGREIKLTGVGSMEVCEGRAFVGGVVDGLRKIQASKELTRREREAEERESGLGLGSGGRGNYDDDFDDGGGDDDGDDDMGM